MIRTASSLIAVLLIAAVSKGNQFLCSTIVQPIFCLNLSAEMLKDRENRLTTEVVCNFTDAVARISTRPRSSSVNTVIVQYSCSDINGTVLNGYPKSYSVDSGDQREVEIDSEVHRCSFYTCFRDTFTFSKYHTACFVNSSNFSCENAIDNKNLLPSPSPTSENTNPVLVLNISESHTQLTHSLTQMTASSTTTAMNLLPTNPTIDSASSASTVSLHALTGSVLVLLVVMFIT